MTPVQLFLTTGPVPVLSQNYLFTPKTSQEFFLVHQLRTLTSFLHHSSVYSIQPSNFKRLLNIYHVPNIALGDWEYKNEWGVSPHEALCFLGSDNDSTSQVKWEMETDTTYIGAQGRGTPKRGGRSLWDMFLFFVWSPSLAPVQQSGPKWTHPLQCSVVTAVSRGQIFQPASCVISTVVLSHRPCSERTTDACGWQRERTDSDSGRGFLSKRTRPPWLGTRGWNILYVTHVS